MEQDRAADRESMEGTMSDARGRLPVTLALAGGLLLAPACAPLGAMDGVVLGGANSSFVEGEVRSVDTRRSRMEIRDHRNRGYTVHFDRRTQVVYRQRQYPMNALERGDVVRVRLVRDRNGALWADRVDVRQSVRERGMAYGRTERVNGTVGWVDHRRGSFTVQGGRNQVLLVHVPSRLSRDDARRFDRLRRGDRVRVEVRPVGRSTAEFVRFR
jgi:hypothetical protein